MPQIPIPVAGILFLKIPDICRYETTPGQMTRMIAQIKQEKDYIYCNYANVLDVAKCGANPPCASTATSPNCKKVSVHYFLQYRLSFQLRSLCKYHHVFTFPDCPPLC